MYSPIAVFWLTTSLVFGGCLLKLAILPQFQAKVWLNYAQLQRLSQHVRNLPITEDTLQAYKYALQLDFANDHIRWQTGEAQAEAGQATLATTTLLPLINSNLESPRIDKLLIIMLVASNRINEAIDLYRSLALKPTLPPGIAAKILRYALQEHLSFTPENQEKLIGEAVGLDPNLTEFKPFGNVLADRDFYATELGSKVKYSLKWRSEINVKPPTNDKLTELDALLKARVAALLDISAQTITLGDSLTINGDFEQIDIVHDTPIGWNESFMSTGYPWNLAAFVMGTDSQQAYQGVHSIRIDGLYIEQKPERELARAGFVHFPINLPPHSPYVVSFAYRTENVRNDAARFFLSLDPQVFTPIEQALPSTAGKWMVVTILGWNSSKIETTVSPLLRSFNEGSVWFDSFSIHPLDLQSTVAARDAIVDIRIAE